MVVRPAKDPVTGVRAGIAVGLLGLALLASAFALEMHAGQGTHVPPGEEYRFGDNGPVHVIGAVDPGTDAHGAATCTVSSEAATATVEVAVRQDAFEAIRVGRRLDADGPTTLVCDRRVTVASGVAVYAYPLARYAVQYPAYLALALLGFGYAYRRARSSSAASPALRAGDDGNLSDLRRFAGDVVRSVVGVAAGVAVILLGTLGILMIFDGSMAGLLVLVVVAFAGAAVHFAERRCKVTRNQPADQDAPGPRNRNRPLDR
jgi:hypothetical protein